MSPHVQNAAWLVAADMPPGSTTEIGSADDLYATSRVYAFLIRHREAGLIARQ